MGKRKEFDFHTYWHPTEDTFELRQIGNLRPPNELIARAMKVADSEASGYKEMSDSDPVYLGVVTVAFVYVPGEPEKNEILEGADSFDERFRVETGTLVGDPVTGEYETAGPFLPEHPEENYAPYQNKGWVTVNGEYYSPDDSKPEGWSSR